MNRSCECLLNICRRFYSSFDENLFSHVTLKLHKQVLRIIKMRQIVSLEIKFYDCGWRDRMTANNVSMKIKAN